VPHRLRIFISSTSDLKAERDAVESVLADMDIDGERFESWPSSPNHPIRECLLRIQESDAVIVLLGKKYGVPSPVKSGTHLEFDHAKSLQPAKPVFPYLLAASEYETQQQEFINIVFASLFRRPAIAAIEELKTQVKNSLRDEFVRRFRSFQEPPSTGALLQSDDVRPAILPSISLDVDPGKAFQQLLALHDDMKDISIHQLAAECKTRFNSVPEIMNLLYMAQVNLAMEGVQIESQELLNAIAFWDTTDAKKRWAGQALYYNQGNAFSALKLQAEAINRFKASLAIKSDFAQCWVNLGNAHSAIKDFPAANECFEKALNIEPNLFQALYSSATIAMRESQDYEKALTFLNRIAASRLSFKYQAAVHGWKANALLKLHRYTEGIAEAENALTNSPDSKWAWGVAGRLYALARQEDKKWLPAALEFWQRYAEKYPQNARAWAEMGYVCWFLRDVKDQRKLTQQALDAFQKSVELGLDDNALVIDRIGHLYQEKDNWVEAEKYFRKASSLNGPQFGFCHGVSLMRLDRHTDALPLLRAAAEHHQPDAMSWHELAICYERTGKANANNLEMAEAAYKKAIEIDPNYAEAWFNLGGYYWNLHDMPNALSTWEIATQKFPRHKDCERVKALLAAPFIKK
jgi:tetratricopeptide (TPR) repeat protein